MPHQVRVGIWETNSSSSHSLSISLRGNYDKIEVGEQDLSEDEIELVGGEYGWGYDKLRGWYEKANYLAVECFQDERKREMLTVALRMRFSDANVIFTDNENYYIDHQSSGEIWSEISSISDCYNILFNDSVYIEIDNDNH